MAAFLRSLLRRSLFRGEANLHSIRDPYATLAELLDPGDVLIHGRRGMWGRSSVTLGT